MPRASRREEAMSQHHMLTAMALADVKALELQAAGASERRRITENQFMEIAMAQQERRDLRDTDIFRLTQGDLS